MAKKLTDRELFLRKMLGKTPPVTTPAELGSSSPQDMGRAAGAARDPNYAKELLLKAQEKAAMAAAGGKTPEEVSAEKAAKAATAGAGEGPLTDIRDQVPPARGKDWAVGKFLGTGAEGDKPKLHGNTLDAEGNPLPLNAPLPANRTARTPDELKALSAGLNVGKLTDKSNVLGDLGADADSFTPHSKRRPKLKAKFGKWDPKHFLNDRTGAELFQSDEDVIIRVNGVSTTGEKTGEKFGSITNISDPAQGLLDTINSLEKALDLAKDEGRLADIPTLMAKIERQQAALAEMPKLNPGSQIDIKSPQYASSNIKGLKMIYDFTKPDVEGEVAPELHRQDMGHTGRQSPNYDVDLSAHKSPVGEYDPSTDIELSDLPPRESDALDTTLKADPEREGMAKEAMASPPSPTADPSGFKNWAYNWVTPPTDPEGYAAWLDEVGEPPIQSEDPEGYKAWFNNFYKSAPAAEPATSSGACPECGVVHYGECPEVEAGRKLISPLGTGVKTSDRFGKPIVQTGVLPEPSTKYSPGEQVSGRAAQVEIRRAQDGRIAHVSARYAGPVAQAKMDKKWSDETVTAIEALNGASKMYKDAVFALQEPGIISKTGKGKEEQIDLGLPRDVKLERLGVQVDPDGNEHRGEDAAKLMMARADDTWEEVAQNMMDAAKKKLGDEKANSRDKEKAFGDLSRLQRIMDAVYAFEQGEEPKPEDLDAFAQAVESKAGVSDLRRQAAELEKTRLVHPTTGMARMNAPETQDKIDTLRTAAERKFNLSADKFDALASMDIMNKLAAEFGLGVSRPGGPLQNPHYNTHTLKFLQAIDKQQHATSSDGVRGPHPASMPPRFGGTQDLSLKGPPKRRRGGGTSEPADPLIDPITGSRPVGDFAKNFRPPNQLNQGLERSGIAVSESRNRWISSMFNNIVESRGEDAAYEFLDVATSHNVRNGVKIVLHGFAGSESFLNGLSGKIVESSDENVIIRLNDTPRVANFLAKEDRTLRVSFAEFIIVEAP